MSFCMKCGNQISCESKFCRKCGAPVDEQIPLQQPSSSHEAKKKKTWIPAPVAGIVLLGVALGALWILPDYLSQDNPGETDALLATSPKPTLDPSPESTLIPIDVITIAPVVTADTPKPEQAPAESTPQVPDTPAWDENGVFAAGEGTAENPYIIVTTHQLYNIRDYIDSHFALGADIDFEGDDFEMIGKGAFSSGKWSAEGGFNGVLDGNGYTIYGINIASDVQCGGLFRSIGENGVIKNLKIIGIAKTAANDPNNAIGLLVGYNEGIIEDCVVSVSVEGSGTYAMVGGIAGTNNGLIKLCTSEGYIQGFGQYVKTGGIAGLNLDNGNITGCSSNANITSQYRDGEITGWNDGSVS